MTLSMTLTTILDDQTVIGTIRKDNDNDDNNNTNDNCNTSTSELIIKPLSLLQVPVQVQGHLHQTQQQQQQQEQLEEQQQQNDETVLSSSLLSSSTITTAQKLIQTQSLLLLSDFDSDSDSVSKRRSNIVVEDVSQSTTPITDDDSTNNLKMNCNYTILLVPISPSSLTKNRDDIYNNDNNNNTISSTPIATCTTTSTAGTTTATVADAVSIDMAVSNAAAAAATATYTTTAPATSIKNDLDTSTVDTKSTCTINTTIIAAQNTTATSIVTAIDSIHNTNTSIQNHNDPTTDFSCCNNGTSSAGNYTSTTTGTASINICTHTTIFGTTDNDIPNLKMLPTSNTTTKNIIITNINATNTSNSDNIPIISCSKTIDANLLIEKVQVQQQQQPPQGIQQQHQHQKLEQVQQKQQPKQPKRQKPNVLCLGMSYPNLEELIMHYFGYVPTSASASADQIDPNTCSDPKLATVIVAPTTCTTNSNCSIINNHQPCQNGVINYNNNEGTSINNNNNLNQTVLCNNDNNRGNVTTDDTAVEHFIISGTDGSSSSSNNSTTVAITTDNKKKRSNNNSTISNKKKKIKMKSRNQQIIDKYITKLKCKNIKNVQCIYECVQRNIITQMDGRDLLRCVITEQTCYVNVYTCSQELGCYPYYNTSKHITSNFNRTHSFINTILSSFIIPTNNSTTDTTTTTTTDEGHDCCSSNIKRNCDNPSESIHCTKQYKINTDHNKQQQQHVQFDQIILDYFWIPSGWSAQHWKRSFFEQTIPSFAKKNILRIPIVQYPTTRIHNTTIVTTTPTTTKTIDNRYDNNSPCTIPLPMRNDKNEKDIRINDSTKNRCLKSTMTFHDDNNNNNNFNHNTSDNTNNVDWKINDSNHKSSGNTKINKNESIVKKFQQKRKNTKGWITTCTLRRRYLQKCLREQQQQQQQQLQQQNYMDVLNSEEQASVLPISVCSTSSNSCSKNAAITLTRQKPDKQRQRKKLSMKSKETVIQMNKKKSDVNTAAINTFSTRRSLRRMSNVSSSSCSIVAGTIEAKTATTPLSKISSTTPTRDVVRRLSSSSLSSSTTASLAFAMTPPTAVPTRNSISVNEAHQQLQTLSTCSPHRIGSLFIDRGDNDDDTKNRNNQGQLAPHLSIEKCQDIGLCQTDIVQQIGVVQQNQLLLPQETVSSAMINCVSNSCGIFDVKRNMSTTVLQNTTTSSTPVCVSPQTLQLKDCEISSDIDELCQMKRSISMSESSNPLAEMFTTTKEQVLHETDFAKGCDVVDDTIKQDIVHNESHSTVCNSTKYSKDKCDALNIHGTHISELNGLETFETFDATADNTILFDTDVEIDADVNIVCKSDALESDCTLVDNPEDSPGTNDSATSLVKDDSSQTTSLIPIPVDDVKKETLEFDQHIGTTADVVKSSDAHSVASDDDNEASGGGVIYLPFCFHTFKEVISCFATLSKFYDMKFLRKGGLELHDICLWYGTQQINPVKMQSIMGKQINQEDIYCTFTLHDVNQFMVSGNDASVDELMNIILQLDDFHLIRFIALEPVPMYPDGTRVRKGEILGLVDAMFCVNGITSTGMDNVNDRQTVTPFMSKKQGLRKVSPSIPTLKTMHLSDRAKRARRRGTVKQTPEIGQNKRKRDVITCARRNQPAHHGDVAGAVNKQRKSQSSTLVKKRIKQTVTSNSTNIRRSLRLKESSIRQVAVVDKKKRNKVSHEIEHHNLIHTVLQKYIALKKLQKAADNIDCKQPGRDSACCEENPIPFSVNQSDCLSLHGEVKSIESMAANDKDACTLVNGRSNPETSQWGSSNMEDTVDQIRTRIKDESDTKTTDQCNTNNDDLFDVRRVKGQNDDNAVQNGFVPNDVTMMDVTGINVSNEITKGTILVDICAGVRDGQDSGQAVDLLKSERLTLTNTGTKTSTMTTITTDALSRSKESHINELELKDCPIQSIQCCDVISPSDEASSHDTVK